MDWTPNTNHTGLYAGQQQGWFTDAGLDVQILPYNSTSPDTLVSSGAADFGISFQDSFTVSKAAGADIVSVLAVLQHWGTAIGSPRPTGPTCDPRATSTARPTAASARPTRCRRCRPIDPRGGREGRLSRPSCSARRPYEALYAGQVDFTEPFLAWEGIEAELRNEPLKTFAYADYGFPDAYSVIVIGKPGLDEGHPDAAAAFVSALQRGYQLGADDPAQGAKLLTDANPGRVHRAELVSRSQEMLRQRYLKDAAGEGRHAERRRRGRASPASCTTRGCSRARTEAAHRAGRTSRPGSPHRGRDPCSKPITACRNAGLTAGVGGWAGRARVLLVLAGLVVWQVAVDVSGVRPQVSALAVAGAGAGLGRSGPRCGATPCRRWQVTAVGFAVSLAVGWTIAVAVDFVPWLRRA
jgi:hypothetical protein